MGKINFGTTNFNDDIVWDSKKVLNGHILLVGSSGSGKTYNIRKLSREIIKNPNAEVHVLDVHGDIDLGDDITSTIKFSETSNYGLNPLEVSEDYDFGGVRKKIRSFISMINNTGRKLGSKQEPVLSNLVEDLYATKGFYRNIPDSWDIRKEVRKNPASKKEYPTINDLRVFAEYKLDQMLIGSDGKATQALEKLNKEYQKLQKTNKSKDVDEAKLDESKRACIDLYQEFINSIETGSELKDILKYDKAETIRSVYERIKTIEDSGIFKNKKPNFDRSKPIKRYDIKTLIKEEQKMFVDVLLEMIFVKAKENGQVDEPQTFIVIDEAHIFINDEDSHIINVIAKEARKFGIALILASQSFTHFSEDFLQSTATKIVLGIDEMYHDGSAKKLRIEPKMFSYIVPHQKILVQVKNKGEKAKPLTLVENK
ncbi:ATP-binding protein [bacterium]|nr:ATP-binding protein [bacterium]